MRVLLVFGALALISTSAEAGGTLESDDACQLALHGTFKEVAAAFRRTISEANGLLTGSCFGDDKADDGTIYFLVVPTGSSRAFLFEGGRDARCLGGGAISRIGSVRIKNDAVDVSEVSSGGLWSMRWFRWVAETIRTGEMHTVKSLNEVFNQTPSQKCDRDNRFPG